MSTTRIKDKISELVNSQLPEFIRTDYTTFVAFLQYYYQFLEQDQGAFELVQNARQYSDIDQTTDAFVNYFLTNYAKDLPYSLQVNKPLLIKRITDLYAAKGSSMSIETLFKVLYDTTATTSHPYDFVLRPSDGKWSLRTSIRVYKTYGSTADIKDRFLTVTKNNINYSVEVLRVKNLTPNLYEIFYQSKVNVPFEIDDAVTVSSSTAVLFAGTVRPTTTAWSISNGGAGFRAGQVINVSVNGAVDTIVRITKVSSTGAIQALRFLNYGYNFTEDITIVLTNSGGVSARVKPFVTTGGGFSDTIDVIRQHGITDSGRYFFSDYVSPFTYTGSLETRTSTTSQILTSTTTTGVEGANDAVINFTIGAVARYPGEYTSTQGFLSEPDVRLQDGNLYQPFAYQISSELDISVFYDIVKKLVHQAGTNMFVNRIISTTANIAANVSVETRKNVFFELNSVFSTLDSIQKTLYKTLDTDSASVTENLSYSLSTTLPTDTVTPTDSLTFNIQLVLSDSFTLTDNTSFNFNKVLTDNVSFTESLTSYYQFYVNASDSTSPTDSANLTFNAGTVTDSTSPTDTTTLLVQLGTIIDSATVTENLTFNIQTVYVDNTSVTESLVQNFGKNIDNTDSTVTFTESGSGLLLNYTDNVGATGYFSEVYAGGTVLTIS